MPECLVVELVALGSVRGRLCGELAAAVARFLTRADPAAEPGGEGAVYYHESEPDLEEATRILKSLGLVRPVPRADKPEETWYCRHALTMSCQAMPAVLAGSSKEPADAALDALLRAFLAIACRHDGLGAERAPFTPQPAYRNVLRALSRAGYAEPVGDAFRWTDRVGPAMERAGLWDERGRSLAGLRDEDRLAQADAAWRTMPDTIRRAHFAKPPLRLLPVVEALTMSWRDGAWQPIAREAPMVADGQIALARRLIDLAQGRA